MHYIDRDNFNQVVMATATNYFFRVITSNNVSSLERRVTPDQSINIKFMEM